MVQENRYAIANLDLHQAQAELDAKQAELNVVQSEYEKAMMEKQVSSFQSIHHTIKNIRGSSGLGRSSRNPAVGIRQSF